MTTHLRARAVQAGAFLALTGGILVIAPAAAQAAPPTVSIDSLSSTDVPSGGRTTVRYTITNGNNATPGGDATIRVSVTGMGCSGDCSPAAKIEAGQSQSFTAQLTAPPVDPGQTKTVTVQIAASLGSETDNASQTVTVRGADKPKTVRQISGRVKDSDGKALSGATVGLQDSAGHRYSTTSGNDGGYQFTSSDSQPIATGNIIVGAAKSGFKTVTVNVQGEANRAINVPLTLASVAATPTATPSATATASAQPSTNAAVDPPTEPTETPAAGPEPTNAAANQDSGSGSLLFIILGGLLVAAGIGAIVLVLMRRKGNDDDSDGSAASGATPQSPNRYPGGDATRVGAPAGSGANEATMVTAAPSIRDAPTMLQQPVPAADEFPDPYGAPPMPQGSYAGPGGWGSAPAAAGAAGAYGAPAVAAGGYGQYGAAAVPAQASGYDDYGYAAPEHEDGYGGYGAADGYGGAQQQQRYDEPTGMYRPQPAGGYDQGPGYDQGYGDQGGYGAEPEYPPAGRGRPDAGGGAYRSGGYPPAPGGGPDQGGYGAWSGPGGGAPPAGGGYGGAPAAGGGYGPPTAGYGPGEGYAPAPGYGPPAGGGYPDQGGPGHAGQGGGYDARATYGRPGGGYGGPPEQGQGRGGHRDDEGYYEQGGRQGGPPPQQQWHNG
ncbi:carboxypeptidase family protein [Krasilnikovia cinnamomea]|uniref:Carboxypeptidase family protein n=1 Tax=Krasilnikovia cinnamomea TaxID=349313 RepID=A0A4Q7ZK25_9ACTN|nr:carboxypeptidase-like regulatory domain-containing protein [Krasilnikovia cinnamomea]RZU50874.1 carboxypeptidase family protein [Krasilnikovia cinnamomea]